MRLNVEWVAMGTCAVEVDETEARLMLDDEKSTSAPCDLDDLPDKAQELVRDAIFNSVFDQPVEIVQIEEVKKKKEAAGG